MLRQAAARLPSAAAKGVQPSSALLVTSGRQARPCIPFQATATATILKPLLAQVQAATPAWRGGAEPLVCVGSASSDAQFERLAASQISELGERLEEVSQRCRA